MTVAGAEHVVFHVGDTACAKAKGLVSADLKDEEHVICSFGRDIVLNGGGTRGCLYAVYDFLDTYCGVRFWNDTDIDVPAASDLALPELKIRKRPHFTYREIYRNGRSGTVNMGRRDPRTAIAAMLNGNGDGASKIPVEYGGGIGIGGPYFCHTFDQYLPFKKFGAEHPEWYSLRNGKRVGGQASGQMCLTNPEVAEAFKRELLDWIARDEKNYAAAGLPVPRIYDLSMNDNAFPCECERCREDEAKYGQSGVMLRMVNEVAAAIAKVRPDIILTTFAYYYTEPVPKGGVRAADNVAVKLCNTKTDEATSIFSGHNRVFRELVAEWRKHADRLFIWDYAITFDKNTDGYPFPSEFHFGDKYRHYADNAVKGIFWELENVFTCDLPEVKFRLMAKLLDDPHQPVEPILRDCFEGYYGPAGRHVRAAREEIDRACRENDGCVSWFAPEYDFSFMTTGCVAAVRAHFAAAEAAVASDVRFLRRVRRARAGFDRYDASGVAERLAQSKFAFTLRDDEKLFYVEKGGGGKVVTDGESAYGKAAKFALEGDNGFALPFAGAVFNRSESCAGRTWKTIEGPGYRWYELPAVKLPSSGYVYFLRNWHFQFLLGQPWLRNRRFAVRVHARFEGPAFLPGTTGENAVYFDAIEFRPEFSIADFGAKADGMCCTDAIRSAIEAVEKAGGGNVRVPAGTWETGPVVLKSNVCLCLDDGAVLRFSDTPKDYLPAVRTSWEGVECYNYSPLVYALGATNVAIVGKGRLEAKMDGWLKWKGARKPKAEAAKKQLLAWGADDTPIESRDLTALPESNLRPPFIGLNRCRGIRLEGFSVKNTPFWTIHVLHGRDVVLRDLTLDCAVINNSDGANFECTRDVLVENCSFAQGDDIICCKSGLDRDGRRRSVPTENVTVRKCRVRSGYGLLTVGSECSGGVRNVLLEDCEVEGSCGTILNVKTRDTRGGFVENVAVRRVRAREVRDAVVGISGGFYASDSYANGMMRVLTRIDGISAEDVSVESANRIRRIEGDARLPVRNVRLTNVFAKAVAEPDVVKNVLPEGDRSLFAAELRVRDPFVVTVGGDRPYLLYMSDSWLNGTAGVSVSTSADLVHWSAPQNVMKAPDWCGEIWAPEIHRWKDAWYMFVTLKEKPSLKRPIKTMVPGDPTWEPWPGSATNTTCHAVWIYRSDSPTGPFVPVSDGPLTKPGLVTLDGTLGVEDGKSWMIYTHDWAQVRVGTYELAPLSDDLSHIIGPSKTLFTAEAFGLVNDRGVTDGAFLHRSDKSGKLFMIWSSHNPARPRLRDYCVLVCESATGRLAGPWVNHRLLYDRGGGHGMFFRKTDGTLMMALHNEEWFFEHPMFLEIVDNGNTLRLADRQPLGRD